MQINAGFQGNVRVGNGGASASAGASISGGGGGGGSVLGNLVTSLVDQALPNLGNMGQAVGAHLLATGQAALGLATGNMALVGQALETEARASLQFFSSGHLKLLDGVHGAPARAHTPPRPREALTASGRVTVEGRAAWSADLKARFKVENGGYGTTADVRLTNMQDFGSIELRGKGSISVGERATLKGSLEGIARSGGGGASGNVNARVGFDIAARTAEHPLLSVLCVASPPLALALFASRALCQGGFAHLKAAFEFNFRLGGAGDVQRPRVDGHAPPDRAGETKSPDKPKSEQAKGDGGVQPSDFLNDPNLTFEDKLFLFSMAMAKRQEDKIEGMMKRWESMKSHGDKAGKAGGTGGAKDGAPSAPGGGGGGGGLPVPGAGGGAGLPIPGMGGEGGGLGLGNIVGVFKALGPMALDLASSTAPMWMMGLSAAAAAIPGVGPIIAAAGPLAMPLVQGGLSGASKLIKSGALDGVMNGVMGAVSGAAGGAGSAGAAGGGAQAPGSHGASNVGGGGQSEGPEATQYDSAEERAGGEELDKAIKPNDKDSEGRFTQLLQKEQQLLSKIFEMCTNMMKASQDSQMSSIRNMR